MKDQREKIQIASVVLKSLFQKFTVLHKMILIVQILLGITQLICNLKASGVQPIKVKIISYRNTGIYINTFNVITYINLHIYIKTHT
jgi:hypothetical protein